MYRLESLPFDLKLQIMFFLDPLSVTSLRQTCISLYEASNIRIVWTNALRDMCRRNSVVQVTFEVEYMSLLELEKAATASTRMLMKMGCANHRQNSVERLNVEEHLSNPGRGPNPNSPVRILQPIRIRYFSLEEDEINFNSVFLVPGSRLLVTSSVDAGVKIWDLSTLDSDRPSSTASTTNHGPNSNRGPDCFNIWEFPLWSLLSICPTSDFEGIRIVVEKRSDDGEDIIPYNIFVLECRYIMDTDSVTCREWLFTRRSHITGSTQDDEDHDSELQDFGAFTLSGDLFITMQNDIHTRLYVWDFVQDATASWDVPEEVARSKMLILEGNIITCVSTDIVTVWELPPLEKRSDANGFRSRHYGDYPPLSSFSLSSANGVNMNHHQSVAATADGSDTSSNNSQIQEAEHHCQRVSDWYTINSENRTFDVISSECPSKFGTSRGPRATEDGKGHLVKTYQYQIRDIEASQTKMDPTRTSPLSSCFASSSTVSQGPSLYLRPEDNWNQSSILQNARNIIPTEKSDMESGIELHLSESQSRWNCTIANTVFDLGERVVNADENEAGTLDNVEEKEETGNSDIESHEDSDSEGDSDDIENTALSIDAYRICDGHIIKCWTCTNCSANFPATDSNSGYSQVHFHVNIYPGPMSTEALASSSTATSEPTSLTLALASVPQSYVPSFAPKVDQFSFDPVMGTLAYLADYGSSVVVLDFI